MSSSSLGTLRYATAPARSRVVRAGQCLGNPVSGIKQRPGATYVLAMRAWWSGRKPKNARAKRALKAREGKLVEVSKDSVFLKGTTCNEVMNSVLHDLVRAACGLAPGLATGFVHTSLVAHSIGCESPTRRYSTGRIPNVRLRFAAATLRT